MFSPLGKKKLLLQIKRAKEQGLDTTHLVSPDKNEGSDEDSEDEKPLNPLERERKDKNMRIVELASQGDRVFIKGNVTSTKNLVRLLNLDDDPLTVAVMYKLLNSTVRYNPERDRVVLKAFESKQIDYDLFRSYLHSAFWLVFTDQEFAHLTKIFDKDGTKYFDGYQFMIAFIKLNSLRKDNEAEEVRRKKILYAKEQALEIERKRLEAEKKMELNANFDYDDSIKFHAIKKMEKAAKDFDPKHPQSPNLDGLMGVPLVKPAEFREILKRTFNLAVDKAELGVILVEFNNYLNKNINAPPNPDQEDSIDICVQNDGNIVSPDKTVQSNVSTGAVDTKQVQCAKFIKYFLKVGLELRDKERVSNLKKQEYLNKLAEDERIRKQQELDGKLTVLVDFDYSEKDEGTCMHKLLEAATKYDKNGPGVQALDGFECDSLSAVEFTDVVRRTFNLRLTPKELAIMLKKYGDSGNHPNNGTRVPCKQFIQQFLKIGIDERYKLHLKQLERQKELDRLAHEEHIAKMKAVQEKKTFKIDFIYGEGVKKSAMQKLIDASMKYDKARGSSLASFEPAFLSQMEFSQAIVRTFNLILTPKELGFVVDLMNNEERVNTKPIAPSKLEKSKRGNNNDNHSVTGSLASSQKKDDDSIFVDHSGKVIHCKSFLNAFFAMGNSEREKIHIETIKKQRQAEKQRQIEHEEKIKAQANKLDIEIDYDYNDEIRDTALAKMTEAAIKYDKSHPAAKSLEGFDCKTLPATLFKEMLRRTFNLVLNGKEAGAIVNFFDKKGDNNIICVDFLNFFVQLGITERAKEHKAMIERQVEENRQRMLEDKAKVDALVLKPIEVDMAYTNDDKESAMSKLLTAAEGFDKNHPAAPSLISFDPLTLTYGQFRESLKRTFNIILTPKELGYLCCYFDATKKNEVLCKDFLIQFNSMGKERRDEKHRAQLKKQRDAIKRQKEEHEEKIRHQWAHLEAKIDWAFSEEDANNAETKMTEAASRFDKNHPAAPSLAGFTSGAMKPVEFNGLIQRVFNLWLTPKELSSLIFRHKYDETAQTIDSKAFLNAFIKIGFEERQRIKSRILDRQRQSNIAREEEIARKKKVLSQKNVWDLDPDFTDQDRRSAIDKLTIASSKYDRNAPGCVSLDAFDAKFLTPLEFKEQLKRTFNVVLTPKELSATIKLYQYIPPGEVVGNGNVNSQVFIVQFLKLGAEERHKAKLIQLELNRRQAEERKNEQIAKLRAAEDKMTLRISYEYTQDEYRSAFAKLSAAAKKYDKGHPGAMSLDGFEEKELNTATFREMLKRTFGLILEASELGAIMHYFDPESIGRVPSKEFLIHFLKAGIAEREKDHKDSLRKLREDKMKREREHQEKLANQWAKMEIGLTDNFDQRDKDSAVQKLTDAAFKFDPRRAGPMGLTAFQGKYMSAAIFREMLKRSFNISGVTDRELAAMMSLFKQNSKKELICSDFMLKFTQLGFERRSELRIKQIKLQRNMNDAAAREIEAKRKALDDKIVVVPDYTLSKEVYDAAFQKLKDICAHFELGSSKSPSLEGFMGTDMTPGEFKDMIGRTFHVQLTPQELGTLVAYFDSQGNQMVDTQDFLAYFYKTVRDEHDKVRSNNIAAERALVKKKQETVINIEKAQEQEELDKLKYTTEDENSFLLKLRKAAQEYAVDSSSFVEPLKAFKGPALNGKAFRETFYRVFLIRFSFAEIGVIMNMLDFNGTGVIDGPRFLNWFYKLTRWEEKIMLNEMDDDITLEKLRSSTGKIDVVPFNAAPNNLKPNVKNRAQTAPVGSRSRQKIDNEVTKATNSRPTTKQDKRINATESKIDYIDEYEQIENGKLYMHNPDDKMQEIWIPDSRTNDTFSPSRLLPPLKVEEEIDYQLALQQQQTVVFPIQGGIITKNLGKSLITNGTNKSNTTGKFRTNDHINMYSSIPSTTKQSIYNNNVETAQLFVMNNVPDLEMIPDVDFKRPKTGVAGQLAAVNEVSKFRKIRSKNTKDITNKKSNINKLIRTSINLHNNVEKKNIHAEATDANAPNIIRNKVNTSSANQLSNNVGTFFFPFVATGVVDTL